MKTKRNTISNREIFLNVLVLILCLSGAAYSIGKFLVSFNQSLYKMNEEPIATITFKYKTAQRKFLDRVIWDRLRQDSPVYDGDIIRTAPLSEATIWFSDGNVMNLFENTMAQVFLNESGVQTELSDGSVSVNSSSASNGITLNSGGNSVKIEKGASLSAETSASSDDANAFKVMLYEGNATLSQTDGTVATELASGTSVVLNSSGVVEATPTVEITSPAPYAKILYHSKEDSAIPFIWKKTNLKDDMAIKLEVSSNKAFSNIVYSKVFEDELISGVSLDSGTWYYRAKPVLKNEESFKDIENAVISEGKLQVLNAPPPMLSVPAQDYVFTYRMQKPAIRFIWSNNEWATAWELEVADNLQMQNPVIKQRSATPSSIITNLGKGVWYWRVTPFYPINNIGLSGESEVHSFVIEQSGELKRPSLILPRRNDSVDTSGSSNVSFSWQNEVEAVSYTLRIADNENLTSPLIHKVTSDNYYTFNPKTVGLNDGIWYWGVTQTDVEGNESAISEVRSVIAAEGGLFQRSIFPPNNYNIAENTLENIRFTWKTNVPFEIRYQVALDYDFNDIVIDEVTTQMSTTVKNLDRGTWYWRIIADTDKINFATEPKRFVVMPPLDKPSVKTPENDGFVIIASEEPYNFEWNKVYGAEYYCVRIYKTLEDSETMMSDVAKEDSATLIYEDNFAEKNSVSLDIANLADGNYLWTLQAFASESETATRRNGIVGEYGFKMRRLNPVELKSPANNTTLDGIDAMLKPSKITWSSKDKVATSTLYVSNSKNPTVRPLYKIENPKYETSLRQLKAGTYYWTIVATSEDGLDVSAEKPYSFTVKPIPPLGVSSYVSPVKDSSFGIDYLRENDNIKFSWSPVKDANKYKFTIKDSKGKVLVQLETEDVSYVLKDLSILDRQKYTWQVEALSYMNKKVLFRKGQPVVSDFTIDLPPLNKPKLKLNRVLYGE